MIPLHRRLAWLAQSYPDAPAISDAAGTATFAQAAALADAMASALRRSGLEQGDRFVVVTGNRRESLLAYVAGSATGTVCTQLNIRLASGELAEIVADAAPRVALCDAEGAGKLAAAGLSLPIIGLDGAGQGITELQAWLAEAAGSAAPDLDAAMSAPLFQLYTSGTTGRPSGIVLSQGAWAAQTEQFRLTQPYHLGEGVLVVTPLFHIAATITAFAGLLSGAHIILPPHFDPAEALDAFTSGAIAGTMMVPAMIDSVIKEAEARGLARVHGVRRICYGASPIGEYLLRRALDLFGCDFIQGYGLTETAGVATILMPEDHRAALAGRPELLRSAGRAVAGGKVRIAREDGSEAAPGEIGEVQIRGPHLFSGYFNDPERTAQAWTADGWFRSGDAGTQDDDGFVYIVDRFKDLIITGGENVFPQEVERVLAQHPAIAEVAVYGRRDPHWGEAVAAALVLKRGQVFDEDELRAFAEARLARFKTPRLYRLLAALPRNATGKVMRQALSEDASRHPEELPTGNTNLHADRPVGAGDARQHRQVENGHEDLKTRLRITAAICGMLAAAHPALAQEVPAEESGNGIADIVVTANRRSENLQTVPITIAALGSAELAARGVADATALNGLIPNLRVNSPFSETQPNFTVRGIGVANEFNPNAQSPIGVYFDEVYQGFRASHGAALFDLERVEVLKGPQGTLYGRNTTGGAINIITRRPDLDGINGYVTAGYGNYNRFNLAAAEATPVQDKLGIRVAVTRLSRDGVIENVASRYGGTNPFVGKKDYDSIDSWAGRVTVRAQPADSLDMTLRAYFSDQKPIGTTGVVVHLMPGGADITGQTFPGIGRRESAATNQGRYRTKSWGVNLKAEWQSGDASVTSVTGYDDGSLNQRFDFDGSPSLIGQWDPNTAKFRSFGQDLHATYEGNGLKLIGGAYFGWNEVDLLNRYFYLGFFNSLAGPNQFNPAGLFFPGAAPTAIDARQQMRQSQWTYAAYLEAEVELTERLKLTLGGRLTHEKLGISNFSSLLYDSSRNPALYTYSSAGANTVAPNLPILTGIVPDIDNKRTEPTGRVILSYATPQDLLLYASYSRGYRSGSFNGQSIVPVPNFVPAEFVDAFEAGFKARMLNDTLQINGAAFYNKYKGQQVQEIQNGASFLRSLNGRLYGFELDLKAKPHPRVQVDASLAYLNTRYDDGQFLAPGDPAALDPRGIALGGNAFPFAPRWSASISPSVKLIDELEGSLTLQGDLSYVSHQYFDPFNDRQAIGPLRQGQEGYALVSGSLRYDAKTFSASLWGRNIFNKYYNAYALNIESFGFDFFTPGAPRTFGAEVTIRF